MEKFRNSKAILNMADDYDADDTHRGRETMKHTCKESLLYVNSVTTNEKS